MLPIEKANMDVLGLYADNHLNKPPYVRSGDIGGHLHSSSTQSRHHNTSKQ